MYLPSYNPWRCGFADAVMGRPCESPWKTWGKNQLYVAGYMKGKKA